MNSKELKILSMVVKAFSEESNYSNILKRSLPDEDFFKEA
jgi:hypothetical protein